MAEFFTDVTERIPFEGPDSDNALAFHWYDADRVIAGRRMEDHLRFAVCYWHSFNWDGFDIFGAGTLDRPWHPTFAPAADPMDAAKQKMATAFEFFVKLGTMLIEPKPFEPTKHQYNFDVAAVHAFLQRYDLVNEVKVNVEVNHATLSGHDFAHEIATAVNAGIFGSIALLAADSVLAELDANRAARYAGWDGDLGRSILDRTTTLASLHDRAVGVGEPVRVSGGQERLENLVARHVAMAR